MDSRELTIGAIFRVYKNCLIHSCLVIDFSHTNTRPPFRYCNMCVAMMVCRCAMVGENIVFFFVGSPTWR